VDALAQKRLAQTGLQPAIKPVIVDQFRRDPANVFKCCAGVPFLGDAKFRGLPAEFRSSQHGGHLRPRHRFTALTQQLAEQLVQAKSFPKRYGQIHTAKLTDTFDAQIAQIRQLPLDARVFFRKRIVSPKQKLPNRGLLAFKQRFDVFPTRNQIVVGEFAQGCNHTLPGAQFGAYRFAQGPVFVDLATGTFAVLAKKHAVMLFALDFPNKGVFSTTRTSATFYSGDLPAFTCVSL
jgi:hypothetical protein